MNRYTGEIIREDKLLRELVASLRVDESEILQKIAKILTAESRSELLVQRRARDKKKASLIMNSSCMVHMFKRGHLTGRSYNGGSDSLPLTVDDLKNIEKVFLNPDVEKIKSVGNKVKIVMKKRVDGKPLALIVRPNKDFTRLTAVTYYNCTPTNIKERLLLLQKRK